MKTIESLSNRSPDVPRWSDTVFNELFKRKETSVLGYVPP